MATLPSISDLLACDPSVPTQLTLALISAVFWYISLPLIGRTVVRPYIDKQAWKQQFVDINQKTLEKSLGISMDADSVYQAATDSCMDILVMARIWVLGTDEEKKTKPPALVALSLVHHALGLLMVMPMNLSFPDYYYYHEGIFLLQFVAFVALLAQMYGYTLNTRTPSGLRQMQICVTLVVLLMGWSRGVRYAVVAFRVIGMLRSEASTAMFVGGCVGTTLMGVINLVILADAVGKFRKFMVVSVKAEKTEEDHELVRSASGTLLRSLSHHSVHDSFSAEEEWGKVRAAVKLGVIQKLRKKDS